MSILSALKAQPDVAIDQVPPDQVDRQYVYWRRRILFSSLSAYALFYFVRTNISVALPAMGKDLGYSKEQLGIVLTTGGVVYGVSKFVNGFLGDRANPRYFMAIGLLICGVMNVAFGMSTALLSLALFWFLNNWTQGMGFPPCARNLGYWFAPEERSTSFGIWNTGHMIGAGLVSVLTGYLVKYLGWRWCFFIPAGIAAGGVFLILDRIRDTPGSLGLPPIEQWRLRRRPGFDVITNPTEAEIISHTPAIPCIAEQVEELSYGRMVVDLIFKSPFVWVVSIANFFVYMLRYAGLHWGPTQLQEMKHITPVMSGWLLFGFETAGVASVLLSGWATDRYFRGRAGRSCTIAMLCMIVATYLFWITPNKWLASFFFLAMGFMIYVPQMLIAALAMNLTDKRVAAAAVGLTGIFGYASTVASGWGVGRIVDKYGWDRAFLMLMGCAVITTVLMAVTWNIGTHREDADAPREAAADEPVLAK